MFVEHITVEEVKEFINLYYYKDRVKRIYAAKKNLEDSQNKSESNALFIAKAAAELWDPENINSFVRDDSAIYVSIKGSKWGENDMVFTDFDFTSSTIHRLVYTNYDKNWVNFMYGKMDKLGLGEEYKAEFAKLRGLENSKEEIEADEYVDVP